MRGRNCLAAGVVGVVTLGAGAAIATAAPAPAKSILLRCTISLATVPPADSSSVSQPPVAGWQYGQAVCAKKGFGVGLDATVFKVRITGDSVGRYTQYFGDGSVHGKFDLTPQEGGDVSSNFLAQDWVGKLTVTGGTGAFQGIKSTREGLLKCSSTDSVHLTCTERIRVRP